MASPLRVLIVTHYALPHIGGIEQATFTQAKALRALGHRVTIVSGAVGIPASTVTREGVRFIYVPTSTILEKITSVPFTLFGPALAATLKKEIARADIVHVHGSLYQTTATASRLARKANKPLVHTEHVGIVPYSNVVLRWVQRAAYALLGRRTLRRAHRVIVLTDEVRAHVQALSVPPQRITTIRNGIDTTFFHPASTQERNAARKALGLPLHAAVLVFNGRLVEKKGFSTVLAARTANEHVILIGESAKGVPSSSSSEHYLGRQSQSGVRTALHAADVYVLPSVGEGFPVATMEALACGLPCVVTNSASNKHYLTKEHAVLTQPTAEGVRKGIREARANKRALRTHARRLALQQFSMHANAKALAALYVEVLRDA